MSRNFSLALAAALLLALSGCGSSALSGSASPATPAADSDPNYRAGYQDGCTTAHGEYKKDSKLFNADKNYYDGWFAGRSACQNR
jgi:hypothetical protein